MVLDLAHLQYGVQALFMLLITPVFDKSKCHTSLALHKVKLYNVSCQMLYL